MCISVALWKLMHYLVWWEGGTYGHGSSLHWGLAGVDWLLLHASRLSGWRHPLLLLWAAHIWLQLPIVVVVLRAIISLRHIMLILLLVVLLRLLVTASIALDYLWFIVSPLVLLVLLVVVILLVEDFTDIIAGLVIAETRIWLVIWLTICHRLLLFLPRVRLFSILLLLVTILECLVLLLLLLLNWLLQGILVWVGVRVQLRLD